MSNILYIVIPAYNEQDNIESVIRDWYPCLELASKKSRLVIIDDGSKDSTYNIMMKMKEENNLDMFVPLTKQNSGHGATLLFGYKYALENGADYVFQTDSDGQTLPEEFLLFWENREKYDIQIGKRAKRQDGLSRIFVTKVLKLVLALQFKMKIDDANTPFRLMSSSSLAELIHEIPPNHNLSNVLLSVLYHKNLKSIQYHPITFRPRQGGVNSINLKRIIKIGIKAVKDFSSIRGKWRT